MVITKNVRQQFSRDVFGVLRRVGARVLQLVGKHADEAIIIRWLTAKVLLFHFSRQEDRLQWSSPSVRLDPAVCGLIYCASPNSDLVSPEYRVGKFKCDAAHIFVFEEVIPGKLHVIEIAVHVEKEGIAAPA